MVNLQFVDLDVGSDGLLYFMASGGFMGATTSTQVVATTGAAHQATLLRDLAGLALDARMDAAGPGRVGYVTLNGFFTATSAGIQAVYTAAALGLSVSSNRKPDRPAVRSGNA
jgi:hypothetical protein